MSDNVFLQLFNSDKGKRTTEIGFIPDFDDVSNTYGVFNNGLFEQEKIPYIGKFLTKKSNFLIPDVPESCSEDFVFENFNKIPYGFFLNTIDFFKKVMTTLNSSEATILYYFDKNNMSYHAIVPEQKVSQSSSNFIYPDVPSTYVPILEIHSHNSMGAFFSKGDDIDEKRAMLYGVAGNLDKENYTYVFRAKKGNFQKKIDIYDIFDENILTCEVFAEDDLSKIKEISYSSFPAKKSIYNYSFDPFKDEYPESIFTYSKGINTGNFSIFHDLYDENPLAFVSLKNFLTSFISKNSFSENDLKDFIENLDLTEQEYIRLFNLFS